jgi:hypothetical protein
MKTYFINKYVLCVLLLCATHVSFAGFLAFPLSGYTPYTVPVTAVLDHDTTSTSAIVTFKGERGTKADGCYAYVKMQNVLCDSTNTSAPRAYKKTGGEPWSLGGINYKDAAPGTNVYMWYDNHRGYDYAVDEWTPIYATAAGTVTSWDPIWGQLTIDHGNGYRSIYTHMKLNAPLPTKLMKRQHIGWVSNIAPKPVGFHLHFVVNKKRSDGVWVIADPYGGKDNGTTQPVLWE